MGSVWLALSSHCGQFLARSPPLNVKQGSAANARGTNIARHAKQAREAQSEGGPASAQLRMLTNSQPDWFPVKGEAGQCGKSEDANTTRLTKHTRVPQSGGRPTGTQF